MVPEWFSIYLNGEFANTNLGVGKIHTLSHSLDFPDHNYECALGEAFLDVSWQNVVDGQFSYSIDGGKEWQHTSIPQGSYKNLSDVLKAVSDQLETLKPPVALKPVKNETQIVLRGSEASKEFVCVIILTVSSV